VPITRMSSEVPRILDGHRRLSIHSVPGTSVILRAGRRLVNCSTGVISSPNGIEMTSGDLRRLQRLHRTTPGDVLEWRPLDRVITSRTGGVVTAWTPRTVVFETALPTARSGGLSVAANHLVARLARTRARTGLGADWSALTSDPTLTAAVDSLLDGRADDAVIRWVGRGPGLTPSGDDLLVGMLAALRFAGAIDSSSLTALRELIETGARRLTTEISAEYLHYACRGMVNGMVRDFLLALDRSSTVGALDAVDRLSRYGHTSGMDCVLGVLTGLLRAPDGHPRAVGVEPPAAVHG
jgi:Protein of unknown function (DUF2877)